MTNWVTCIAPSGDNVPVNFDNATSIHRNDLNKLTLISFVGEDSSMAIKETVKQLFDLGLNYAPRP